MWRPTPPMQLAVALLCLLSISGELLMPLCEGCVQADKRALLDIHSQLSPLPHIVWEWWDRDLGDGHCCQWPGVTCNSRSGRVTGLDLGAYAPSPWLLNATMFLPLQELQTLSLYINIKGCIPGAGILYSDAPSLSLFSSSFEIPVFFWQVISKLCCQFLLRINYVAMAILVSLVLPTISSCHLLCCFSTSDYVYSSFAKLNCYSFCRFRCVVKITKIKKP